jgi:hypothetical protein
LKNRAYDVCGGLKCDDSIITFASMETKRDAPFTDCCKAKQLMQGGKRGGGIERSNRAKEGEGAVRTFPFISGFVKALASFPRTGGLLRSSFCRDRRVVFVGHRRLGAVHVAYAVSTSRRSSAAGEESQGEEVMTCPSGKIEHPTRDAAMDHIKKLVFRNRVHGEDGVPFAKPIFRDNEPSGRKPG